MARYAKKTTVSSQKSRMDIEKLLTRYKAKDTLYGTIGSDAWIVFKMRDRSIKIVLALPPDLPEGATRAQEKARDQVVRQKWRIMHLIINARLEAVESGVETFEQAWLPYFLMVDKEGRSKTVGEIMGPQLQKALDTNRPHLLQLTMS